ncbi:MAG: ATP-binding protein [Planctomycetota bacterium]
MQQDQLDALRAELEQVQEPEEREPLLRRAGALADDLGLADEAKRYLREGLELACDLGRDEQAVFHAGRLAGVLFNGGEFREAVEVCLPAVELARELGADEHAWRIANIQGASQLRLGEYRDAIDAFEDALDTISDDDALSQALLHLNLATAHLELGQLEGVDELLDLAREPFEDSGHAFAISGVEATRADLRLLQERPAEARELHARALATRRELGVAEAVAESLIGLARADFALGDPEAARVALEEAIAIAREQGHTPILATATGLIGEVYGTLERADEAAESTEESLRAAGEGGLRAHRMEALFSRAAVLASSGDNAGALEAFKEAVAIERELHDVDARERAAGRRAEIELVEERVERRTERRWVVALGTSLLTVSMLFGWTLFLTKRRALRRLDLAHRDLAAANAAEVARAAELASALDEIRELQEERIRAAKLESLGVLAAGIAHDFNNVLTAILGNVSIARSKLERGTPLGDELQSSEAGIEQATRLARQLLALSRGGAPVRELCDLRPLIREAATLAATGSSVLIRYRLAYDLWPAEVDPGQVGQVVSNLVLNAVQALPDGGKVWIGAENFRTDAGPCVRLTVEDSGPGIPADLREKVFDPYFSTKAAGNGLGLTTAYAVVDRHGGRMRLRPSGEHGAGIVVELPAAPDAIFPLERREPPVRPHADADARVLVLDDEAPVRELYGSALAWLGYRHVLTASGRDAIDEFVRARDAGRPFDILVLDLTLPGGMGGTDVLTEIAGLAPGVVALASSGYADSAVLSQPEAWGFAGALAKPFTVERLDEAIRAALARAEMRAEVRASRS